MVLTAREENRELRERRERYKRFTYGDQWCDQNPQTGKTEGETAEEMGYRPMTNNLIRQLVKSVIGLYRREIAKKWSGTDRRTAEMNSIEEIDARTLEEFLISGCAIQRVTTEKRIEGEGVWVDMVSPSRFFVNPFKDPRGRDIELTGMIHEMSPREIMIRFGEGRETKAKEIASELQCMSLGEYPVRLTSDRSHGKEEVIEMWVLEARELLKVFDRENGTIFTTEPIETPKIRRENRRRKKEGLATVGYKRFNTLRWHCKWLLPTGYVLREYDSPWPHCRHPFAIKYFPLTDGEVHSFVEDVTEQQKCINRMVTLIDKILSVSAKGALLFPTDRRPEGFSWAEIGKIWSRPGSIIPYRNSEQSEVPRQISGGGDQSGATSLLNIQMKMIEQVSGVTGALQGRDVTSNTSAALYDARTKNAATTLIDLLESFVSFINYRNMLIAGS